MKILLLIAALLLSISDSNAQNTPAEDGFVCSARCLVTGGSQWITGYGKTTTEAAAAYGGLSCSSSSCQSAGICQTGGGYVAADHNNQCSNPPDDDDDESDDDDDGDCESGESTASDCNDGDDDDTDSDGDGDPDSSDPDDGICYDPTSDAGKLPWQGDGDQDPDCEEDEEEECIEGSESDLGLFDISDSFDIPATACASNMCQYERVNPLDCYTSGTQDTVKCLFEQTGETCETCDVPSCTDDEDSCPTGQHRPTPSDDCVDTEDYCEIDEENNITGDPTPDGTPDNEDAQQCIDEEAEEDPIGESGQYSCGETPPDCSAGDPILCDQLNLQYENVCGVVFNDVFDCEVDFECESDPIGCVNLEREKELYCANKLTEEQLNDDDNLAIFREGVDDGADYEGGDDVEGSIIDLDDLLDDLDRTLVQTSGSCISDETINVVGISVTFPFSEWCPIFELAGQVVMLLGFFFSFRIVAGAF